MENWRTNGFITVNDLKEINRLHEQMPTMSREWVVDHYYANYKLPAADKGGSTGAGTGTSGTGTAAGSGSPAGGGDDGKKPSAQPTRPVVTPGPGDGVAKKHPEYVPNDGQKIIITREAQLQHAFSRHAKAFGYDKNWSPANGREFLEILQNHVDSVETAIKGSYRGDNDVLHFYDPLTSLDVMLNMDGTVAAAWKLSPDQILHLMTTGNVQ